MSNCCELVLFQTQLQEFRTQILGLLENPTDISAYVNKLTFAQCTYLLSVYWLETLRVQHSPNPSLEPIFEYLVDRALITDKNGMWYCIARCISISSCLFPTMNFTQKLIFYLFKNVIVEFSVSERVFAKFLEVMSEKPKDEARERELETHAVLLLVYFNHIHKQVRRIADRFVPESVKRAFLRYYHIINLTTIYSSLCKNKTYTYSLDCVMELYELSKWSRLQPQSFKSIWNRLLKKVYYGYFWK